MVATQDYVLARYEASTYIMLIVRPPVYCTAPWRTQSTNGGTAGGRSKTGSEPQRSGPVSSGNWADSLAILMAKNNTQRS